MHTKTQLYMKATTLTTPPSHHHHLGLGFDHDTLKYTQADLKYTG